MKELADHMFDLACKASKFGGNLDGDFEEVARELLELRQLVHHFGEDGLRERGVLTMWIKKVWGCSNLTKNLLKKVCLILQAA